MRPSLLLLVCVLVPALAFAVQPAISPEIVSAPLRARVVFADVAAPAVAMARDRQGVAIAWTMQGAKRTDMVYVARLNRAGNIAGAVVEVPTTAANGDVNATYPSIAVSPTGTGFTVAWTELYVGAQSRPSRVMYCRLDASLKPSTPRALTLVSHQAPAIVRSGKATWIASGNSVWPIHENGTAAQPLNAGTPVSDMVANADFPRLISAQRITNGFTCLAQPGCMGFGWPWAGVCYEQCRIYDYSLALQFVSLNAESTRTTFPFNTLAQPAMTSNGENVLIAWLHGNQTTGGTVNAAFTNVASDLQSGKVIGRFSPDSGATRPDIATDGERYVIAWRTTSPLGDHDIAGAMIDLAGNVTEFSIATSDADERDPSVIATANGTFLVAYEKVEKGERRIAGRFLSFGARRRAAR